MSGITTPPSGPLDGAQVQDTSYQPKHEVSITTKMGHKYTLLSNSSEKGGETQWSLRSENLLQRAINSAIKVFGGKHFFGKITSIQYSLVCSSKVDPKIILATAVSWKAVFGREVATTVQAFLLRDENDIVSEILYEARNKEPNKDKLKELVNNLLDVCVEKSIDPEKSLSMIYTDPFILRTSGKKQLIDDAFKGLIFDKLSALNRKNESETQAHVQPLLRAYINNSTDWW